MTRRAVLAGMMVLGIAGSVAAVSACRDECDNLTRVCNEQGENCRCAAPCATSADCGEAEYCLGNRNLCMPLSDFAFACGATASCNGTCASGQCEKFCQTDGDCGSSGHCGSAYRRVGTSSTESQKLVKICRTSCAGCGTFVDDAASTLRCYDQEAPGQTQDVYQSWHECACEACPECEAPAGTLRDGGAYKICSPVRREMPSAECQSCVAKCSDEINSTVSYGERATVWAQACCTQTKCPSCAPANKLGVCTPPEDACTRCLDRVKTSTCAAAWNACSLSR